MRCQNIANDKFIFFTLIPFPHYWPLLFLYLFLPHCIFRQCSIVPNKCPIMVINQSAVVSCIQIVSLFFFKSWRSIYVLQYIKNLPVRVQRVDYGLDNWVINSTFQNPKNRTKRGPPVVLSVKVGWKNVNHWVW